ncbi:hypothetical protein CC78DRAFT_571647 [Lojkania enalia]|uniref:Uncharacterized protein n=1 Tax=Lojkania enalia TaxID=147567 RepID=A0A9P4K450_9PLEO|nr:hypothetical protein CC78DRAFT_571647 [Didymosphaeria enalia]
MRSALLSPLALLASASAIASDIEPLKVRDYGWHPITKRPTFFNLFVDEKCGWNEKFPDDCPLGGYVIRLADDGTCYATRYNKWWSPPPPIFFVDEDTAMYTVNKHPLQMFVDEQTGQLKWTKVGHSPPPAISVGFHHLGNNPNGLLEDSPSILTWPLTSAPFKSWYFCESSTGDYVVYVDPANWEFTVTFDVSSCKDRKLAALNANPWLYKKKHHKNYPHDTIAGGAEVSN